LRACRQRPRCYFLGVAEAGWCAGAWLRLGTGPLLARWWRRGPLPNGEESMAGWRHAAWRWPSFHRQAALAVRVSHRCPPPSSVPRFGGGCVRTGDIGVVTLVGGWVWVCADDVMVAVVQSDGVLRVLALEQGSRCMEQRLIWNDIDWCWLSLAAVPTVPGILLGGNTRGQVVVWRWEPALEQSSSGSASTCSLRLLDVLACHQSGVTGLAVAPGDAPASCTKGAPEWPACTGAHGRFTPRDYCRCAGNHGR
jgi:hypothetical protein